MKEDLSNYPEKFVYRIAKSLKADGFDFKPYYDHHFQDNLPIVEEASSLYGIDIPEDFFVELYRLNGEESMFEKGYFSLTDSIFVRSNTPGHSSIKSSHRPYSEMRGTTLINSFG